jgi:pantoate--beta-alanine ligase
VEAVRTRILEGEQQTAALVETMRQTIAQAPDARIQYTEVVDAVTLQPIGVLEPGQEVLAAVAVFFGATRLIDNVFVRVPQPD